MVPPWDFLSVFLALIAFWLFSFLLWQVTDPTRVFRLLGSDRVIIIESRMVDDVSAASNLYILAGN